MSRIQPEKYCRKPLDVQAIQVTEENMADVALWCKGGIFEAAQDYPDEEIFIGDHYIKVPVNNPFNERQAQAFTGDWVIKSSRANYKVYTDKAFKAAFVKSTAFTVTTTA